MEGQSGLRVIADALSLSTVTNVLFWGCDVDQQGDIQQLLNILIRTIDGQLKGTMTEPDLVIVTEREVAFVECKLNLSGNQSPWKAQRGSGGKESGAARRMKSYVNSGFRELEGLKNWEEIYQLIRQYVYATRMARALQKQPVVVPVINAEHTGVLGRIYSTVQECPLNTGRVFKNLVTWQEISAKVASSGLLNANRIVTKIAEALETARKKRRTAPST